MRKIGQEILRSAGTWGKDRNLARIHARTMEVHRRYRSVIEETYGEAAPLMLANTNSVYITRDEDQRKILTVYVQESIFSAELNAYREKMKMLFFEMFGEDIAEFNIRVSRGRYKTNHPFSIIVEDSEKKTLRSLRAEELAEVERTSASIADPRLRKAFEKAMITSMGSNDDKKD